LPVEELFGGDSAGFVDGADDVGSGCGDADAELLGDAFVGGAGVAEGEGFGAAFGEFGFAGEVVCGPLGGGWRRR